MSARHNMPPWHTDYFELKAIKTQQTQENFYLSLTCLMDSEEKLHQKGTYHFNIRWSKCDRPRGT